MGVGGCRSSSAGTLSTSLRLILNTPITSRYRGYTTRQVTTPTVAPSKGESLDTALLQGEGVLFVRICTQADRKVVVCVRGGHSCT